MFDDKHVYHRLQLKSLDPILFGFHYINECTRIVGGHNKHENVIAIWDKPIKKVQP
jgi:hypothetical protein